MFKRLEKLTHWGAESVRTAAQRGPPWRRRQTLRGEGVKPDLGGKDLNEAPADWTQSCVTDGGSLSLSQFITLLTLGRTLWTYDFVSLPGIRPPHGVGNSLVHWKWTGDAMKLTSLPLVTCPLICWSVGLVWRYWWATQRRHLWIDSHFYPYIFFLSCPRP